MTEENKKPDIVPRSELRLPLAVVESDANFLQKPFTPQSLCRKVRETLRM